MYANTTLSKESWIHLNQRLAARTATLLLLLFLTLPAAVQAQFNYTINDGTVTITGYTGPVGPVTIPSTIAGLPVTGISAYAFVTFTISGFPPFPPIVTEVGSGLTSVTIPDSVTSIGDHAFYECTNLASVTIGNGVTNLADEVFRSCTSLSSITIPNSVTSIGYEAFYSCTSLTSVTIPNGVTSIGQEAFESCTSLTNVTIGNSVTSIGQEAFESCTSLTNVTIPNSVTSIGDWAFEGCASLANITIPDSVTTIGVTAFGSCTSLTSLTIPNSVTDIGVDAFFSCTSLTNVAIGNGVTNLADEVFCDCSSLTAITVDALNPAYCSVDGVLFDKSQTTVIQCPGRKAGSYAIPNSVTSIGDEAFGWCTSLTSVTIPNSVTNIGYNAFDRCYSLTNVTIPNSVTSIKNATFQECTSLTRVAIPNSVTSIGNYTFLDCSSLTSVIIPNSVTRIGDFAFCNCVSLTGVYFQGNAPSLGMDVFEGDNNATVYSLWSWSTTFGGRPTALWPPPTIQTSPQIQTAEAGSAVGLRVNASSLLPLFYFWYLNATNLLNSGTNWQLNLPSVQLSQSGAYTVVISNVLGSVTSAPVMLNVIAPVERRPVPGVKVTGQSGSLWNVDYADSLSPTPNWTPLDSVSLTGTPQYCFDLTLPLPPQRFYRAWQAGTPGVRPSLDLHLVPAITLTGTVGHSVRLDYINQFGPTDAWVALATVQLTNTSQLYFDTSSIGRPARLWRIVPVP